MSIDINWETITSGPDGEALAESIRAFVHDKFQQITLPGFIRSVQVHSFDFGTICPELEIKDIGDPMPDFYDDEEEEGPETEKDGDYGGRDSPTGHRGELQDTTKLHRQLNNQSHPHTSIRDQINAPSAQKASPPQMTLPQTSLSLPLRSPFNLTDPLGSAFPRSGTPGIPGGTSNLSYFHLPVGGLSGTQTPLTAVASGTNYPTSVIRADFARAASEQDNLRLDLHATTNQRSKYTKDNDNDNSYPSVDASLLNLPSNLANDNSRHNGKPSAITSSTSADLHSSAQMLGMLKRQTEPQPQPASRIESSSDTPGKVHYYGRRASLSATATDLQIVTHVKYAGDIRLILTAEILLDYPMPSFVGIPLKLSITGLKFDGMAVLASIGHDSGDPTDDGSDEAGVETGGRSLRFCFLSEEDAEMLVGRLDLPSGMTGDTGDGVEPAGFQPRIVARDKGKGGGAGGSLLEEIKVESEIGRQEDGKQVLKNVGKVERFVLEQIRRIFEEEFVWPSFWTFLI